MGGQGDRILTEVIMFFRQLSTTDSSLSYCFGCTTAGKAMAVDVVAGDEDWFVTEAVKSKSRITHVVDSHVHADHYSGGRRLAEMTGAADCLHQNAAVRFPFHPLRDGDTTDPGNVIARVLHTPGHTLDSICLLVTDKRRGEAPRFVVTGDTLFVGSVGRLDLAGREQEMAGQLYETLRTKLLTLPDEVEIFPGHQARSVCGAGLSGIPSSTIGFEKRFNPGLRIAIKDEFVRTLVAQIPPRPAEMDKIVAANVAG
jgi:glyoxylase-like metal-dependent hydrolase (beta-lactamase superfamily II)